MKHSTCALKKIPASKPTNGANSVTDFVQKASKITPSEKQKHRAIVKTVQETFDRFEKGEITIKGLEKVITNDLKIGTKKFDELIKSAREDNKTFKSLMESLSLSGPEKEKAAYYPKFKPEEIKKNSTKTRYPRYYRIKEEKHITSPTVFSNALPTGSGSLGGRNILIDYVNKFVKGYFDAKGFEEALKSKNINPNIEEIGKHIRSSKDGGNMNYKNLMVSVLKYQDSKFANDPEKVKLKPNITDANLYSETLQVNNERFRSVLLKNGNAIVLNKRKNFRKSDSTKQILCWSLEDQCDEDAPEECKLTESSKLKTSRKFIVGGQVFQDENNLSQMLNPRKINLPYPDNGNILIWEPQSAKMARSSSQTNGCRKRDPNFTFETEPIADQSIKVPIRKINTCFYESEDNGLRY